MIEFTILYNRKVSFVEEEDIPWLSVIPQFIHHVLLWGNQQELFRCVTKKAVSELPM